MSLLVSGRLNVCVCVCVCVFGAGGLGWSCLLLCMQDDASSADGFSLPLRFELTDKNGQPSPTGEKVASGFTNAQGVFYIQEHLTPAEFNLVVASAPNFVTPSAPVKVGVASMVQLEVDGVGDPLGSKDGVRPPPCLHASVSIV